MNAWALTTEAVRGEVWRLWTGHLAHYDAVHLLLNVAAALPPLFLLTRRDRRLLLIWALFAAPAISAVILMSSSFGSEYRGASALVMGLWVFVGIRGRSAPATVMLIAATLKVAIEMSTPLHLAIVAVAPLPVAHFAGAACGFVWALVVSKDAAEGGGAPLRRATIGSHAYDAADWLRS
jgi:membrane associated rhomboid family serine protease